MFKFMPKCVNNNAEWDRIVEDQDERETNVCCDVSYKGYKDLEKKNLELEKENRKLKSIISAYYNGIVTMEDDVRHEENR